MALQVLVLLVCLVGLGVGQRQRPWEEDDKYWKVKVDKLGDSVILNCTVNNPPVWGQNSSYGYRWLLNNLTFIANSSFDGKYTIQYEGWDSDPLLTIVNVSRSDFGIYHCIRNRSNGQPWMVRRGVNLQGPYFENLAEKYRNNIIIGVSACFGFVAFMVMVCLAYQYRWPRLEGRFGMGMSHSDWPERKVQDMRMYENAYENSAFTVDGPGIPAAKVDVVHSDVSRL